MLGETVSDWSPEVSGLPQGSVLGPTLFAIFINDLPDDILASNKMFADDTKLIAAISPYFEAVDRAKLQDDIDRITEWCNHWHMSFNTAKCKVINIGGQNQGADYTIRDQNGERRKLTITTNERDLGVQISKDLKPHDLKSGKRPPQLTGFSVC